MKTMRQELVNARFSEELRGYREKFTIRGIKNKETNLILRKELDVIDSRRKNQWRQCKEKERRKKRHITAVC